MGKHSKKVQAKHKVQQTKVQCAPPVSKCPVPSYFQQCMSHVTQTCQTIPRFCASKEKLIKSSLGAAALYGLYKYYNCKVPCASYLVDWCGVKSSSSCTSSDSNCDTSSSTTFPCFNSTTSSTSEDECTSSSSSTSCSSSSGCSDECIDKEGNSLNIIVIDNTMTDSVTAAEEQTNIQTQANHQRGNTAAIASSGKKNSTVVIRNAEDALSQLPPYLAAQVKRYL